MVENLIGSVRVSDNLLGKLLKGDYRTGNYTKEAIREIESELGAYFLTDPVACIGVIYHPNKLGWERPMLIPDASDFNPKVQAVANIGMQAEYWGCLMEAVKMGKLGVSEYHKFSLVVLSCESEQTLLITSRGRDGDLEESARVREHNEPLYNTSVYILNQGGGVAFWGLEEKNIFPMNIETINSDNSNPVGREELGLDSGLVRNTWSAWMELDQIRAVMYQSAVEECYRKEVFPDRFKSAIEEKLKRGGVINADHDIINIFVVLSKKTTDEEVSQLLTDFKKTVRSVHGAIDDRDMFVSIRRQFIDTAQKLSDGLQEMYMNAKNFVGIELYPYA